MSNKHATPEIRMTPNEVAEILGNDPEVIRAWLRSGGCPFGHAVQRDNSYKYIVIRKRFELYMAGCDLGGHLSKEAATGRDSYIPPQ